MQVKFPGDALVVERVYLAIVLIRCQCLHMLYFVGLAGGIVQYGHFVYGRHEFWQTGNNGNGITAC